MADEPIVDVAVDAPDVAPDTAPPVSSDRRAAALAALEAIDSAEAEPEDVPPADDASPVTVPAPSSAPEPKVTTLQARLVRQDRELQALRAAHKGAVTFEQLQKDPLGALKAAGHTPDKLMDMWLGASPSAAVKPDGEPRSPSEIVELKAQLQQMGAYLQQQQQEAQQARESSQAQQALQTVHQYVTAEAAGDPWETIAARANETGLSNNGGGAYHLAAEVGNILATRAIEQLGPYATHEEKRAAASGALEEALDRVEAHLVEDAQKRSEAFGKIKKLKPAAAPKKPAPKSMPGQPVSETRPKGPLSIEERRKAAIRAAEALDRKGS